MERARNHIEWLELIRPGNNSLWIHKVHARKRMRPTLAGIRPRLRNPEHWSEQLARSACTGLGVPWSTQAQRGLRLIAEPPLLECNERDLYGRRLWLAPRARRAWLALRARAAAAGIRLLPVSGFRSIGYQQHLLSRKLRAGQSLDQILSVSAAPGFSEHHGGCALDLAVPGSPPLDAAFALTAAYAWLQQHAGTEGFVLSYPPHNRAGYVFEPWHWCFRGP